MDSEMKERIREAANAIGGQRRLSEKTGIVERTIANWTSGTSEPKSSVAAIIADATGVSLEWLITGKGPMKPRNPLLTPKTIPLNEFRTVPRYNAAASAGHGAFVDYAEKLDDIPFTEEFVFKRLGRLDTKGLIIVDAAGDSMEPTIGDNDLIMIDTNKTQLTAAIFAFTYEDSFFVKRLNHLPDAIEARSDNAGYPPFIIEREQMNRVDILGRVVWVGHTP